MLNMLSSTNKSLIIMVIILCFDSSSINIISANEEAKQVSQVPDVVIAQVGDNVFKIPYYEPGERPLPDEIKQHSVDSMKKIMAISKDIVRLALIQGKTWTLYPRIAMMAPKFIGLSMYLSKKDKEFRIKYGNKDDRAFLKDSVSILPDLMARANEIKLAQSDQNINYKDKEERARVGEKMLLIFDGVEELIKNSPVGMHVDFRKMTMNGKSIIEEATECIIYMQETGLGSALNKINNACCKLDNINVNQQEIPAFA